MPNHIKTLLRNDIVSAFVIAIIWQLIMTLVGYILLPTSSTSSILHHTVLWDSGWYLTVIEGHYIHSALSAAFYPLFPLTIGLLHTLTFSLFSYPLIGLLVNTIALGIAIAGLLTIAKHFDIEASKHYACVALFLLSPATFFLHMFYGEAIFVGIAFWAYAFALQKKWLFVGILLAFLTASRLPSLLFIGLCGLEFLRAHEWKIKKALNPKALYFLLAPTGFVAYGLYLFVVRGDFFAMFSAYKATNDWIYQSFNPNFLYPIARGCYQTVLALAGRLPLTSEFVVNVMIPLFSLAILFACSLYLLFRYRGKGIPLGIFGLVSIIFFTLNNNLVSVHRYTLPCLGIYIALTHMYIHYRRLRPVVIAVTLVGFVIQILLITWLFTTNKFVG